MGNRKSKTPTMLRNKIEWNEVSEYLNISIPTLRSWRNSGDPNKNEVIDLAIEEIAARKIPIK